jgi:hypothetical protein
MQMRTVRLRLKPCCLTIKRLGDDPQFRGSIQASILRALEWTPCRISYLGEAPPKVPHQNFFRGAPRLNDQSDRVSILGVGISRI